AHKEIDNAQPPPDAVVAVRLRRIGLHRIEFVCHGLYYRRSVVIDVSEREALAVSDKALAGCQQFADQLWRGSFRVKPQQRLRSRRTEQDPRFCSISVSRCVEEK